MPREPFKRNREKNVSYTCMRILQSFKKETTFSKKNGFS